MGDLASYLFHQGTNYSAYDFLGCTCSKIRRNYIYHFRTWAPNASRVELLADFSGWDKPIPMQRITDSGIWEVEYRSGISLEKSAYKYKITSPNGVHIKGDPYARFSKGLDDGASLVYCDSRFTWRDRGWLNHRRKTIKAVDGNYIEAPLNIYEVHLGSFLRHDDGSVYSYREAADVLAPYVKSLGFTHIELLPIMEHPFDGSWGYQVCGFFAPSSRFGDPNDFKYFVNKMHSAGVGVILDWVPAHFPKDEWGLYEYDGSPLYEYQGVDRQESSSWGTRFFDLGREEVQCFLISSALYFLREFHIDGLRVDAVASMLYLDYDRSPGEWVPNINGDNISLEAVAFFKKLNSAVLGEFPDVLMIAEESGSYGNLTKPVSEGGLGFSMKWNMGWANDFYDYISTNPIFRKHNHKALNFPLMYAFKENYCLPISHDEVVHGKKSLIDKMFGDYEDKFRQMRCALLLMMTYPGKKLMFMGTEFAQFREWDYAGQLEWFMLDYPRHYEMREYTRALNLFYLAHDELWSVDFKPYGFDWLLADESEKNCVAYRRKNVDGESLIIVINFSGDKQSLTLNLAPSRYLETLFETSYGVTNSRFLPVRANLDKYTSDVVLPPFSGVILKERKHNRRTIKL